MNTNVRQATRVGVYAVMMKGNDMLLIRQKQGPYGGKFDFPGGGIEFGESPEQALRRELAEEVAMEFDSFRLIDNLTTIVDVSGTSSATPYSLYQIGMIYRVEGYRFSNSQKHGELEHFWVDLNQLSELECSKLLWAYKAKHSLKP